MATLKAKTLKRLLASVSVLSLLGAMALVTWASWGPLHRPKPHDVGPVAPLSPDPVIENTPPLTQFAIVWNRRLQRPLFDTEPTATLTTEANETAPIPAPAMELLGIYDQQYAVVRLGSAQDAAQTVAVGDGIAGATVTEIGPDKVVVVIQGNRYEYRLQKTK